jgi:hypothetical protein
MLWRSAAISSRISLFSFYGGRERADRPALSGDHLHAQEVLQLLLGVVVRQELVCVGAQLVPLANCLGPFLRGRVGGG